MMYKKFAFLISLLLLAGLAAGPALAADPVAYWNFNDGTADDSSGNGHDGTLSGSRISIIDDSERGSKVVDADNIASTNNSVVDCGSGSWADITSEITIAAWFTLENIHTSNLYMFTKGSAYQITSNGTSDGMRFYMSGLSTTTITTSTPVMDGKWHHLAVTYDSAAQERIIYIDGIPVADDTPSGSISTNTESVVIAGRLASGYLQRGWDGRLDDVRLYNAVLTEDEVRSLAGLTNTAYNPSPADGTGNVDIDTVLSWSPGDLVAATQGHDVYFGTNWADVNDGISAVHIGKQDNNSYDPDLQAGTTYFWVVDEVNDSHQDSPWLGTVWSFRTENEGFFKDLFMDGGANLTSRTSLPAAELLGLAMEYLATSNSTTQNNVMVSNSNDDNGALLYPDGQARFRCIYTNGGASVDHGSSLGETGRQRVRDFYANRGSYTGSCAGSAICTIRVTTTGDTSYRTEYYHIWPARGHYSQLADSYTGHDIPTGSPLLDYFDFGGDNYIYHVRHNGGNYTIDDDSFYWCTGTEVLSTFAQPIEGDDTQYQPFMGNVSAWAYKDDANSGRLCPCGSHPEAITGGEQRDYQAALIAYAMDGQGSPNVKAALSDGVTRQMNNNSSAGHEKIGDKQYHQFTIDVPSQTTQLTITLDGDDSYDLNLFTKQGDSAFKGGTGVTAATNGSGADEEIVKSSPAAGTWYIGVKCNTTVTSALHSSGEYYEYTGATGVLNGVAYSITATLGTGPTTPGVTIAESGESTDVAEEGPTTDTYTVVLDSLPTATVTITVDPDIETEVNNNGAGNSIDLTFLTTNWDTEQTVTVKAIDDASVEGAHTSTITHTAASSDNDYDGISIDSVVANVTDNDVAGVTITESGDSTDVDEEGPTSDTYTVVLDTLPTDTVTITVDPDGETEVNNNGAGNSINLTFLTTNWDTAQTVTVKAIDDEDEEGDHTSTITHTAVSSDNDYDSINIDDVVANVTDNDVVPGVTITESGDSTDVAEEGPTTDTYTVVLDSLPTATVTITVDPDVETEVNNNGAGNSIDLTFLTTNWDTEQTVTVKAIDDSSAEGAHTSTITHTAASSDNDYDGISIDDVVANVTDNDVAGVTITESGGSTDVAEEGPTSDTYTVVLDTLPTDTVTITVDPDDDTEVNNNGAGNSINLTFLTTNWDTAQTVTVKAIDDEDVEGAHTSTITHTAVSNDNDYDSISIDSVVANVTDNDVAGVTITESGGSTDVDEEGPTSDTYTVVLDTLPTDTVTITVDPDGETEVNNNGAGNSINLTFLTTNWDTAQTVTVKAIDDVDVEGAHTSTITHTAVSNDNDYDSISIDDVVANVTDNDQAPALPWSDGFESGNFTTGGWTIMDSLAVVSTKTEYTGTYGAQVKKTTWMEKALSTEGFTTIHVKYRRMTKSFDSGENLYVEWSTNGTNWYNLETVQTAAYGDGLQDKTCDSGANNNSGFRVRFRTDASNANEYAGVDDVEITGTEL